VSDLDQLRREFRAHVADLYRGLGIGEHEAVRLAETADIEPGTAATAELEGLVLALLTVAGPGLKRAYHGAAAACQGAGMTYADAAVHTRRTVAAGLHQVVTEIGGER
jgi:hypothetical protein